MKAGPIDVSYYVGNELQIQHRWDGRATLECYPLTRWVSDTVDFPIQHCERHAHYYPEGVKLVNVETETLVDTVKQNADEMTHWACGVCYKDAPEGTSIVSFCGETKQCRYGNTVRCPMCWAVLNAGRAPCGHRVSVPSYHKEG
jgi:hypothetical protein